MIISCPFSDSESLLASFVRLDRLVAWPSKTLIELMQQLFKDLLAKIRLVQNTVSCHVYGKLTIIWFSKKPL
jgi:hypothetical protein